MIVYFSIEELNRQFQWTLLKWLKAAAFVWLIAYYYKALKYFYRQGRVKTLVKLVLALILAFFTFIILATAYLGFMAMKG